MQVCLTFIQHSFTNLTTSLFTGKPDLFITMTCNPYWPEITRELLPGQLAEDRPDIVARVFKLKFDEFLKDISERHIFGRPQALLWVIEFQKRQLPHGHILTILHPDDKPKTAQDVDRLVCAELPDRETEPELFHIVTTTLLHGPCGVYNPNRACTKDNKCTRKYPRPFREETTLVEDGYPAYRRRDDGRQFINNNGFVFTNRHVVPHPKFVSFHSAPTPRLTVQNTANPCFDSSAI